MVVAGNMGKRVEEGEERDAYRFLLAFSVLVSAAIARCTALLTLPHSRLMNERWFDGFPISSGAVRLYFEGI